MAANEGPGEGMGGRRVGVVLDLGLGGAGRTRGGGGLATHELREPRKSP